MSSARPILTRTVAPAGALLSLLEAKAQLRIEHADEDALIEGYVRAATAALDGPAGRTGRALLTQTWVAKCPAPSGRAEFRFPVLPLIALSSIGYFDRDNQAQSLDVAAVTVFAAEDRAWMVPAIGTSWPAMHARPDALTVTWTAGYGATAAAVPANIVQAARLLVAHWYERREAATPEPHSELPLGVEALIGVSRLGWIGA